jgi:hypothetical protein
MMGGKEVLPWMLRLIVCSHVCHSMTVVSPFSYPFFKSSVGEMVLIYAWSILLAVAVEWSMYITVRCLLQWTHLFIHHDISHASFVLILCA